MIRVWNVTDDPRTDLRPRVLMILQRSVAPGKYVSVQEGALEGATRIREDEEMGLISIGDPSPGYFNAKNPPHLTVPEHHTRAHGVEPVVDKEVETAVATLDLDKDKVEEKSKKKYYGRGKKSDEEESAED